MIKLIGVLIVIAGFIFKFDTLAVVVVAGVVTGFVGGMSFMEILTTLGNSFVTNRTATLFVLTLSVIGMCERYGLKDKAVDFIKSIKNASTGRLLAIWQTVRTFAAAFSLRIGGHAQFIRPLINPMAQAAYVAKYGETDDKVEDEIKGLSAGTENYGNFFAQNCFMGSSGTLLIVSTLVEQGYEVTALDIAAKSWYIAIASIVVGVGYALLWDMIYKKRNAAKGGK
ncbi:MAG: DUF969 domain-containing protein [Solobacterium sp.]|nr:DUF969 domain-containing protein [Solobacterium sp.]MDD6497767.1 DUF969 domain-containing protein [Solobacterium sp.]MDD6833765.1 DUF969 domain-containing protein [Solobacterium sp.]MDD6885131.1 DUF969 domain-containing protein [Solobacterium sp.]